jgi:hypothetical protein
MARDFRKLRRADPDPLPEGRLECLGLLQIARVEAFSEPTVHRSKQSAPESVEEMKRIGLSLDVLFLRRNSKR